MLEYLHTDIIATSAEGEDGNGAKEVEERDEQFPGLFLELNDDDDDGNETPDNEDNKPQQNDEENDLGTIQLKFNHQDLIQGNDSPLTFKVERIGDSDAQVRIWKGNQLWLDSRNNTEKVVKQNDLDTDLTIEGNKIGALNLRLVCEVDGVQYSTEDVVRVNVIKVDFVVPGETYNNGEDPDAEPVPAQFIGVSDPRPTVELDDIGSENLTITETDVTFTISGTVYDPIADNMSRDKGTADQGGADIKEINVFVDDSDVADQTVEVENQDDPGKKGFWKQHPYKGTFSDVTVSVLKEAGDHFVLIKTSENAAGYKGETGLTVSVDKRIIPGTIGAEFVQTGQSEEYSIYRNIAFNSAPTADRSDLVWMYCDERDPGAEDPIFTETDSASLIFSGLVDDIETRVIILGYFAEGELIESPDGSIPFDESEVDVIRAVVVHKYPDKQHMKFRPYDFVETKESSLIFRARIKVEMVSGVSVGGGGGEETEAGVEWTASVETGEPGDPGIYCPYNIRIQGLDEFAYQARLLTKTYDLEDIDGVLYLKGSSPDHHVLFDSQNSSNSLVSFSQNGKSSTSIGNGLPFDIMGADNQPVAYKKGKILTWTRWLVTHDPAWEKNYAQKYPKRCKQAVIMSNEAVVRITCKEQHRDYYQAELYDPWKPQNNPRKKCLSQKLVYSNGVLAFYFRTSDGRNTESSVTDSDGHIYVENKKLPEGVFPRKFKVKLSDNTTKSTCNITVGPVITHLKTPEVDILEGETLDPYSDEFDILDDADDFGYYNHGFGYGLEIHYRIHDKLKSCLDNNPTGKEALITIENLTEDELQQSKISDIEDGEKHYLTAFSSVLFTNLLAGVNKEIKWEGFSSSFVDDFGKNERADKVFMEEKEAEREVSERWHPVYIDDTGKEHRQTHKGASVWSSVGEGCYKMKIGVKRFRDEPQKQKFEINLEIKTKTHEEFYRLNTYNW